MHPAARCGTVRGLRARAFLLPAMSSRPFATRARRAGRVQRHEVAHIVRRVRDCSSLSGRRVQSVRACLSRACDPGVPRPDCRSRSALGEPRNAAAICVSKIGPERPVGASRSARACDITSRSWRAACKTFMRSRSSSSPTGAEIFHRERIDDHAGLRSRGLDQAQHRVVRAFAHEFRVQRDEMPTGPAASPHAADLRPWRRKAQQTWRVESRASSSCADSIR